MLLCAVIDRLAASLHINSVIARSCKLPTNGMPQNIAFSCNLHVTAIVVALVGLGHEVAAVVGTLDVAAHLLDRAAYASATLGGSGATGSAICAINMVCVSSSGTKLRGPPCRRPW